LALRGVSAVLRAGVRERVSMAGRGLVMAAIAALAAGTQTVAAEPKGSLYPAERADAKAGAAKALGAAGYAVTGAAGESEFNRAVQAAIALHPTLHAETAGAAAARAETRAARAALYPRLSANLDADFVIDRQFAAGTTNVVESLRPDNQVNGGLTASQLVFDGGAAFARIRSAKARHRASDKTIDARINDLALTVLAAYHDVAAHQAMLALGADYIARHEKLVADMRERERLGAGSRADVLRAEGRLAQARVRVAQIRESARIAEVRYQELYRAAPETLAFPDFAALQVASREEAVALALDNNPLVKIASARTDSARADVGVARASRLPEVRASVSSAHYDVFRGAEDYDVRAGLNLNYDLYAGGARGAEISRAKRLAERQKFEEDLVRQEVERDAAIAFERRRSADERLAELERALIANHSARNLVAERFRASRGDLTDVIQAENDWFEAGVGYIAGLADRDLAVYELMAHTGDLLRLFSPREEDRIAFAPAAPETPLSDAALSGLRQ
jgi:adhesin transport system outer membrane protein